MLKIAIIFGGSGYIGGFLIRNLLDDPRFDLIYNLDLVDSEIIHPKLRNFRADVRQPIRLELEAFNVEQSWIINLAALCREPGSEPREYFETNVADAENVCLFAKSVGFQNIFFTSTMSSYGRIPEPTVESDPQYPETPYGVSKLVGEKIHQTWLASTPQGRLIICRPSVIFGPRDVGNMKRMVKAIRKGYFFFPGNPKIFKAYGYIYDLIKSINFTINRVDERYIVFNFAQYPLLDLGGMAAAIKKELGKGGFIPRVPICALVALAYVLKAGAELLRWPTPIHPVRVRKMAFPTHIKPQYLIDNGFEFEFTFESALAHWKKECPEDFS